MTDLAIDSTATLEHVVGYSDTAAGHAPRDGSVVYPAVFATPRMIGLMEQAGAKLLLPCLGDGEQSVGITVDVAHTAASPVGATVRATARYLGREGKLYVMEVVAEDEGGEIGRGTHKRAIISVERLVRGAKRRNGLE